MRARARRALLAPALLVALLGAIPPGAAFVGSGHAQAAPGAGVGEVQTQGVQTQAIQTPGGWVREQAGEAVVFRPQGGGAARLVLTPVQSFSGPAQAWFKAQAAALAGNQAGAEASPISRGSDQAAVFSQVAVVRLPGGGEQWRVLFGVTVGGRGALVVLAAPSEAEAQPHLAAAGELAGEIAARLRGEGRPDSAPEPAALQAVQAAPAPPPAPSAEVRALGEQVRRGLAVGGRAEVYTRAHWNPVTGFAAGWGTTGTLEREVLVLLPGGAALRELPTGNLRRGEFGELTEPPLRWSRQGGGVTLTGAPGGAVRLVPEPAEEPGQPPGLRESGEEGNFWWRAPDLRPEDWAGTYEASEFFGAAGGTALSGSVITFGANAATLVLHRDGRYELSETRGAGGVASGGGGARETQRREAGRWSFDPPSFTLTFTPDQGPVRSVFAHARPPVECLEGVCVWMIGEREWKR